MKKIWKWCEGINEMDGTIREGRESFCKALDPVRKFDIACSLAAKIVISSRLKLTLPE
jgi:hypothetical protein